MATTVANQADSAGADETTILIQIPNLAPSPADADDPRQQRRHSRRSRGDGESRRRSSTGRRAAEGKPDAAGEKDDRTTEKVDEMQLPWGYSLAWTPGMTRGVTVTVLAALVLMAVMLLHGRGGREAAQSDDQTAVPPELVADLSDSEPVSSAELSPTLDDGVEQAGATVEAGLLAPDFAAADPAPPEPTSADPDAGYPQTEFNALDQEWLHSWVETSTLAQQLNSQLGNTPENNPQHNRAYNEPSRSSVYPGLR